MGSMQGWLGLDTETNGKDIYHGVRPYLVSFCDTDWNNTFYEWEVNPLDRSVKPAKKDIEEIAHSILTAKALVIQNSKFDISVLTQILPSDFKWPYEKIHDPLFAAHLIASNKAKDLTSLALDYLEIDISPYEEQVAEATKKCRRIVRRKNSPISGWRIAKEGLPEMPSVKKSAGKGQDKQWKNDMWLPREVALFWHNHEEHHKWLGLTEEEVKDWLSATSSYCNADSASCLHVFLRQMKILEELGLWEIYEARRELIPCLVEVEQQGVTISEKRYNECYEKFQANNKEATESCLRIARSYDYSLVLPKGGKNNSLATFVFDVMKIPPVKIGNERKKKTSAPSLDRKCIDHYLVTLPPRSKQLRFITSLASRRATDIALSYLESYKKFWVDLDNDIKLLHPSYNPTGTDTLRMSSSNPNAQNISKREGYSLRYLFGPKPGREWYSLDYENLELRIPAYECQEPAMLELFESPNAPPCFGSYHLLIFSILHSDKYDHGDPEGLLKAKDKYKATWYQWTKNGNFADLYGAQEASGTADLAFHTPGAQHTISKRLKQKSALNQKYIDLANKYGYVETLPDKTINSKRGYPLLCTRSNWGSVLPTVPLNYHVQGSACWVMMRAMIKTREYLNSLGNGAFITANVHDEIVLDLPVSPSNDRIVNRVKQIMRKEGDNVGVKLTVSAEYHPNNWAEK